MKKIKLLQDDTGNWYLIPNELEEKFIELLDLSIDDMDYLDIFEAKFTEYRIGKDPNKKQLYAYL